MGRFLCHENVAPYIAPTGYHPSAMDCPSCRVNVSDRDVDRQRMIARCSNCNAVFDASPLAGSRDGRGFTRRRAPVPMPDRFEVKEEALERGGESGYRDAVKVRNPALTIVRRWYNHVAWAMVVFLVFWNGVLYKFIFGSPHAPLAFRLFPLIHVAAGLFVAYYALALLLNKTTITVTDGEIEVRHAPLPWPGNKVLDAKRVVQLFTEERVSRGKNGESRSYALSAVMEDGRREEVVKGLPEAAQAWYLEQRIEARLGIVDVAVGGEYKG